MTEMPEHTIHRTPAKPAFNGAWDGPVWRDVQGVSIAWFHPASSEHRPVTHAKLLYDASALYAIFRVEDRYVRATR
ncbi:MAG: hypothetical protein U9Q79_12330, partial [Candidatus Hydrogenedentes bacterium]|nr:hypothetical protein [Candidatus Hydrogenedentota bacterium]